MCGLVGIFDADSAIADIEERIEKMKASIAYRGPDDQGNFIDRQRSTLAFGHNRLAIIDPEFAKQPMSTNDGELTVVFNGAIYNHLELRRELIGRGHTIQSYSDTEVILHAYREWDQDCVQKFNGMFAFAIWDKRKQQLFCARDRIGIKPFYFHQNDKQFVFASEIKALVASGLYQPSTNQQGLIDYFTFQFCLNERTLFKDVTKLEPGYTLTVNCNNGSILTHTNQYWDVDYDIDYEHDESYFSDHIALLLEDSVRQHLRSDVPLGAYLSGGLDSSAIVSIASPMLSDINFKTFTGAFADGPQYDETNYAKLVAEHSGAEYHEMYIPDEFSTIFPKLIHYMDEPTAGPGLIPQYYVSRMASEHVKVILGGQGGDEVYIGYARYLIAYLEKCLHASIFQTDNGNEQAITLDSLVPNLPLLQNYKPMLQHFLGSGLFTADDQRYFHLINRSEGVKSLLNPDLFTNNSTFDDFSTIFNRKNLNSLINKMTYFDLKASLPALLHVEDRMSMSASLESRVPLLDHRLIEFVAKIPPKIKFASGKTKHILKQAVKNTVPKKIIERTDKMGFPVPLQRWLQNNDRSFVYDILFSQRARERGIYNIKAIEKAYKNEGQFGRIMWGMLCLELWHQIHIDQSWQPQVTN